MPEDLIKRELKKPDPESDVVKAFGSALWGQFERNKAYRRPKEMEWLESLRQYKGLYDPNVKIDADNSHVYPKLTRSKINIVLSRLHEMLFPELDRNWELLPTPEPKIAQAIINQLAMSLVKQPPIDPQTGQPQIDPTTGQPMRPVLPTVEEVRKAIKDFSAETSKKMQNVIDDQLVEMDYSEETKKVLRSGLLYGTGVMKGPLVFHRTKRRWEYSAPKSEYIELNQSEEVPYMEFVRIWDWYPDMSTDSVDQCMGFFQRHIMNKHDLRLLMKRDDFYGHIISDYLKSNPDGDYKAQEWEIDLQAIEVEAGTSDDSTKVISSSTGETSTRTTYRQLGKRYEVLEFWGYVDGNDLAACGATNADGSDIDPSIEYTANVWLLGKLPIKVMLHESALDHYKVFYYEKDETSIFGEGLARVMRHSQIAISSAARMVLDNAACVAGPQLEVNWTLLTGGTDYNSFYPRKIWYREGRGVEAQYPAIRSLQFDSNIPDLLSIIKTFTDFGDVETCLPTWLISQQGNNETAQAASGRMSTITISIKDVVKNFDTFTEHIMRDLYNWNMEFNDRQDIKGDFQCHPRGVSSLVMKEIRMAALTNLKNTMAPEDWAYVPRRQFLEEVFKSHDFDIKLRSEDEAQEYIASQQDKRAQDLAYQQMEAEIAYKKSQTMGQLTKAKKFNADAYVTASTPPPQQEQANPELQAAEVAGKEAENMAKVEQMRRDEESHALDLQEKESAIRQQDEKHRTDMATSMVKNASDISNKQRSLDHSMKLKEKMAANKQNASKQSKKPGKEK